MNWDRTPWIGAGPQCAVPRSPAPVSENVHPCICDGFGMGTCHALIYTCTVEWNETTLHIHYSRPVYLPTYQCIWPPSAHPHGIYLHPLGVFKNLVYTVLCIYTCTCIYRCRCIYIYIRTMYVHCIWQLPWDTGSEKW